MDKTTYDKIQSFAVGLAAAGIIVQTAAKPSPLGLFLVLSGSTIAFVTYIINGYIRSKNFRKD